MKLRSSFILLIVTAFTTANALAQKTANYSLGKPGTAAYQHYSFWAANGKPTDISFTGGADRKESKVIYNGKTTYQGKRCFKMTFANGRIFYVYPIGQKLAIVNAASKKLETFSWEYEGPVDGKGTFCSVCVEDEKEAMTLIKTAYLK